MERKIIAVLFGGCSPEYEVSLQSACSVLENLNPEKYSVIPLGITRRGQWLRYGGGVEAIADDSWWRHHSCARAAISPDRATHGILVLGGGSVKTIFVDAVFPVLHGKNGEDGTVQGLSELAGIPCVGCGALSSALCMDKDMAHRLARAAGIKTPESAVLRAPIYKDDLYGLTARLSYPLFVKPANAGSSFGVTRVVNAGELPGAVEAALEHDRKVIIEEAVEGFEVGCAVLGNEALTIGLVDEIELTNGIFDYTEKYTLKTARIHMPARIDEDTAERIKRTVADIYRALGCSGFARVDMFLTPEKEIVFNEVNTIPGLTTHSRYPNMLRGVGMTLEQILDELIELALET